MSRKDWVWRIEGSGGPLLKARQRLGLVVAPGMVRAIEVAVERFPEVDFEREFRVKRIGRVEGGPALSDLAAALRDVESAGLVGKGGGG
jgi:hypothetical protein